MPMTAIQERQIFKQVLEVIRRRLPEGWAIKEAVATTAKAATDTLLQIKSPSGERATMLVELKRRVYPNALGAAFTQPDARNRLLVSSFIPPAAKRRLIARGMGFADPTGNVRLMLSKPGLFIEAAGASSDPTPRVAKRSLKSVAASRVIRALIDTLPPFRLTEVAARSRADAGLVSRLLLQIEQEGLLTRQARGSVTEVNWDELIRRWAQEYRVTKNNAATYMLEPRGLTLLLSGLRTTTLRYALTGSVAASMRAAVAPPALAMLYVESPNEIAEAFKLRPARTGGNVVLLVPRDSLPFEGTTRVQELVVAAPSQVAADLLTGPGRSSSEADAFLDWMKENENEWRR
jgi:hypothetical protein